MKWWKDSVRFYLGGMGYMALELLWRGWSHGSMCLVGGLCFLLLGKLPRCQLLPRSLMGASVVTGVELVSGLVINEGLGLQVWDYSAQPFNFMGQVCLGFFFLWIFVSAGAMYLWDISGKLLFPEA